MYARKNLYRTNGTCRTGISENFSGLKLFRPALRPLQGFFRADILKCTRNTDYSRNDTKEDVLLCGKRGEIHR